MDLAEYAVIVGSKFAFAVECELRNPEYIDQILDYTERAEQDDAPDSADCVCRILDNGYY